VLVGWGVLVSVGIVGTLVFGYLADSAGGESARQVVVSVWAAGTMFCVAGMFNAMWRAFWFTWKATRRARRDGVADERFARAMRGILPRNSSLIGQSIVAVLTLVIVLV
jgi:nicotinamide riboside transporter PnuC